MKILQTMLLACAFAATTLSFDPALAQAAPTVGAFIAQMPPGAIRLSKVIGVQVIGLDHRSVGEIAEVTRSK